MDPAHDARDDENAEDIRLHESPWVRMLLIGCGMTAVMLGVIGIFLPVLPTTPFLLVAAACFARASPVLYRWLASSRWFGPYLREWRRHRSVPWRAKVFAITLMSVSVAISAVFFVQATWGRALLVATGIAVAVWLYRIPSRDAPRA